MLRKSATCPPLTVDTQSWHMFSPPPRHAYFHNIELNLRDGTKLELIKVPPPPLRDQKPNVSYRAAVCIAGKAYRTIQDPRSRSTRTTEHTGTSRFGKCTVAACVTFQLSSLQVHIRFYKHGQSPRVRALGVPRMERASRGRQGSSKPQDLARDISCRDVRDSHSTCVRSVTNAPPKAARTSGSCI